MALSTPAAEYFLNTLLPTSVPAMQLTRENMPADVDYENSSDVISIITTPAAEDFEGIISERTLRLIETVVNAGILPVLVLFGVTGNIINMAVFLKQGLGDRINLCLFSLAISDTGFNLSHLASRTFAIFNLFDTKLGAAWQARAFSLTGVYLGFLLTSNTLTLVIAIQRCIIVVSPLTAKKLPSSKQMAVVIISLFVLCMLGTGAYSFKWEPTTQFDPDTNVTIDVIKLTDVYVANRKVWDIVVELCFNVFVPVTSFLAVLIANLIIAVRMRSVLAWRKDTAHAGSANQQAASAYQREAAMTKMLLVLCVIYTICTTPTACQALARVFELEFVAGGKYNNAFYAALCFSHLLESVNCSVNFVIYYTMSSKFNETLRGMFSRKGKRKKKDNGKGQNITTSVMSTTPSSDHI